MIRDRLLVEVFETREEMGKKSAADIKLAIAELLEGKDEISVIFDPDPSLFDCYRSLIEDKDIDWSRINAYCTNEFLLSSSDAKVSLGDFIRRDLFDKIPLRSVDLMEQGASDIDAECERYSALLAKAKPELAVLCVGEGGNIAFNEPCACDFSDTSLVKRAKLDGICRNQQVNDGFFGKIDEVPENALTLTVPALMASEYVFAIVPSAAKAQAVYDMISYGVDETCPASILRNHSNASLYLDKDSASYIR